MEQTSGCIGLIMLIFLTVFFTLLVCKLKPSAIEVYQGKTTLEYKIIDGEVIDSCVVYKQR